MSDYFKTIDLSGFILPGDIESRFSSADVPTLPGVPFVTIHLKNVEDATSSLRMDLDKRVFLDVVSDETLRQAAPELAQHISGVAFPYFRP